MDQPTTSTYSLLGLLGIQQWTSYELTHQARRSLRWTWPRSEAHLYTEQKRLVRLGWASAKRERVGRRMRTRYAITAKGRGALRTWLATDPSAPRFEVEGVLRVFFAEAGTIDDLRRALQSTADAARAALDDAMVLCREYLDDDGPFPERLHLIALASVWVADSLALLEQFCLGARRKTLTWDDVNGPTDRAEALRTFAQILERHGR